MNKSIILLYLKYMFFLLFNLSFFCIYFNIFDIVDDDILCCTWGCSRWMWTGIRGDVRNPLSDVTPGISDITKIRGDVTQGISDITPNSGSHPSAAPPSAAQDVIVDYITYFFLAYLKVLMNIVIICVSQEFSIWHNFGLLTVEFLSDKIYYQS